MGVRFPSRHHLKYQYPLLNHRLAALVSALCFGCFLGRRCSEVRVQVQCASTVISISWLCLWRTLFLLIILIYARLRNAQRTW
jgi:hypothetical protein